MTDSEKKETLEKILNLEVFVRSYDLVKDNLRTLEAAKHEAARRAKDLTENVLSYEEKISAAIQRADRFDEEKRLEISELKEKKKSVEETVSDLRNRIDSLDVEGLDELRTFIGECDQLLSSEEERKRNLADAFIDKRNDQIVIKKGIERDIKNFTRQLEALADPEHIGESCTFCGNSVTAESLGLAKDGYQFNISDMEGSLRVVTKRIDKLTASYKGKAEKIDENIQEVRDLLSTQQENLQIALDINNKRLELLYQLKAKEELIHAHKGAIKRAKGAENVWKQAAQQYGEELSKLMAKVEDFEKEVATIDTDINYYGFWKNAFSRTGIRSFLLDKIVPFLNERVGHYLGILTDDGIEAEFSTVKELASGEKRENFNLLISNRNASDSYEGNSGGEKRRIDLGVALGFNDFISSRSGKRFNLLVLDEVFEGVDADGLYYVIKVLEDIARRKSSVFVITHRDELKSYFSDEILMSRKDGLSYIENINAQT
jgi:DNA repair exonuclease SbcCD ATPase subunit